MIKKETILNWWLDKHWLGPRNCPVCQSSGKWLMDGEIFELPSLHSGRILNGGVVPLTTLMCDVCGYTILFNAIKIGIVEK